MQWSSHTWRPSSWEGPLFGLWQSWSLAKFMCWNYSNLHLVERCGDHGSLFQMKMSSLEMGSEDSWSSCLESSLVGEQVSRLHQRQSTLQSAFTDDPLQNHNLVNRRQNLMLTASYHRYQLHPLIWDRVFGLVWFCSCCIFVFACCDRQYGGKQQQQFFLVASSTQC